MRTRPVNAGTLKQRILTVLNTRGRCNLKTIADDILATGYQTASRKFANTVRVQLYRLDDDGIIIIHEDGTYSLKNTLNELLSILIGSYGLKTVLDAIQEMQQQD